MKLCVLTHTLNPRTGAGVFSGNIIEGIRYSRSDIEFSIMTSGDYLKPSIYSLLGNWLHIRDEIRGADIVHALDGYPYGVIASLANIGISKPLVITAVGSGSIRKLTGFGWKQALLRWAYRRAVRITAISHYIAQEVKKTLPDLSIEVINPGVDYSFYSESASDLSGGLKYIVSQGEFKRRKGYNRILPIMKKVIKAHPDIKYIIVADINNNKLHQKELYRLMDKLGIRDKVIIRSHLSYRELRETYRDALLYLAMPLNDNGDVEGFGMAIMEAAATGTPAIVARGSGANDTILEGKSGFLVNGENENAVIAKILTLIEDEELRRKLQEGALRWASENRWGTKVKQYLDLYDKI